VESFRREVAGKLPSIGRSLLCSWPLFFDLSIVGEGWRKRSGERAMKERKSRRWRFVGKVKGKKASEVKRPRNLMTGEAAAAGEFDRVVRKELRDVEKGGAIPPKGGMSSSSRKSHFAKKKGEKEPAAKLKSTFLGSSKKERAVKVAGHRHHRHNQQKPQREEKERGSIRGVRL